MGEALRANAKPVTSCWPRGVRRSERSSLSHNKLSVTNCRHQMLPTPTDSPNPRFSKKFHPIQKPMSFPAKQTLPTTSPTNTSFIITPFHLFPFERASQKYKYIQRIADGGFGSVSLYSKIDTRERVAIKEIGLPDKSISRFILRECCILIELRHDNIVRLQEVFVDGKTLYLVMDYIERNLESYKRRHTCNENKVKEFLKMLLEGIAHCHQNKIIHRDIKPKNLLVDVRTEPHTLKICDFGFARFITRPDLTPGVGTYPYEAPEILLGSIDYSFAADMWSIGCVLAQMIKWLSGDDTALFDGTNSKGVLTKIFSVLGTPDEQSWSGVTSLPRWDASFLPYSGEDLGSLLPQLSLDGVDLLKQLLCLNPEGRVSAHAALHHCYLSGV